jgi:hypothetical protein
MELLERMERLGFYDPGVTLNDFINLLPHTEKGKVWVAQFLTLQADINGYMAWCCSAN